MESEGIVGNAQGSNASAAPVAVRGTFGRSLAMRTMFCAIV